MERKTVRDYENQMLFIREMKQELSHLTYLLECSSAFFFKHPTIQKERETLCKIIALASIKLDEIISPVVLTELDRILKPMPKSMIQNKPRGTVLRYLTNPFCYSDFRLN